ncbi:hypothetical protein [Candidatus Sororendozoicomonas aggregata]|uniref:hypothetical protein n=1 Tax=Candidatus Sororendozoicomonas aggregata TaxID=3073239 RepID=UPI002ED56203
MPYCSGSGKKNRPIAFNTPSVDTKIETVNGNFSVLYAFNDVENAYFILTRVMQSQFFVITCYYFENAVSFSKKPEGSTDPVFDCHPCFLVQNYDTYHCLEMHIREKPTSKHNHIGLPFKFSYHLEDIAPLLHYYFSPLTDNPQKSAENFIKAIHFFQNNPMIPGIFFSDNEYAQINGYNKNGLYPHGPYELWNDSVHPGLSHVPGLPYPCDMYDLYRPYCNIL